MAESLKSIFLNPNKFSNSLLLTYLNASGNNFEGNLPNDLSNVTVLEILDLRGNYFGGPSPNFI